MENYVKKINKSNIFTIFVFIAVIFIFTASMDIREIMDYPKIKAAGKKTLTPVSVKQKTGTRQNRHRTTKTITNYVQFTVEINGAKRSFWLKTSSAYGKNSASAGIEAVSSKKQIERYIFYTEDSIYSSKNAATKSEYIIERIKIKLIIFFILAGVMSIIFFIMHITYAARKRRKNPE